MKRISILLAICLLLDLPAQAAAPALFQCKSDQLGFSVTVPGVRQGEIIAEETDTGVNFYHVPSREKYGGEIGSVVVVSPRSDFFSGHYDDMAYQIIAMGKNQVFLWKTPGGGAPTGGDFLDAFRRVSSAFSMENLRKGLVPAQPDGWPKLQITRHLAYLPVNGGFARPNAPLTRGELAQMLYTLLDDGNKADSYRATFSDTAGKDCAQAVAYPVGQYGEEFVFADVPAGYWAETYIYSTKVLGWLQGGTDRLFHPEREITRAEAVTAINRMLGRDESVTELLTVENPFSDLAESHWAYANVLEAAGVLKDDATVPKMDSVPLNTSAYHFSSESDGWAASEGQLFHTTNGGKNWDKVGRPLACAVSGLFFLVSRTGSFWEAAKRAPASC